MRRIHTVVVVALLVAGSLALTGPVAADPPSTDTFDQTELFCFFESDAGEVEFIAVTRTDADGWEESEASVFIFPAEGEQEIFTENPFDVVFAGGTFEAELDLVYGETGEPAGTAFAAGSYEQDGELEIVEEWSRKFGNVQEEVKIEIAPIAVTGELEVMLEGFDPQTFDLAECDGQRIVETIWHTNPTSFVNRAEGTYVWCSLEQDGWVVELFASTESDVSGESFLDLVAWGPDTVPYEEEPAYYGFAEGIGLTGFGGLAVEVPLWEPMVEEPTEVALVDAVLSEGDLFNVEARFQDGWFKVEQTDVVVDGVLTLPDVVLDMAACEGVHQEVRDHFHPDQSQGKGKVPANDLPAGALELTNRSSVQTRMAAEAPEAACVDPDFGELPLGKTVWYAVEGTGDELTIDTAGSDFDTVVGVYLMEGDELVHEACLDDNRDETGIRNVVALTFATMPDTTYYVQIGGFDGQYGHLKVALR